MKPSSNAPSGPTWELRRANEIAGRELWHVGNMVLETVLDQLDTICLASGGTRSQTALQNLRAKVKCYDGRVLYVVSLTERRRVRLALVGPQPGARSDRQFFVIRCRHRRGAKPWQPREKLPPSVR